MADDAKPSIPGPKPGEAAPAAKPVKTVEPSQDKVEPASVVELKPMSDVLPAPEPDPESAQAARAVDPAEPHDFLEEDFKRDQSGAHPVEMSPAEVVASSDPAHTIAKGLNEAGDGANGMTLGDRVAGL